MALSAFQKLRGFFHRKNEPDSSVESYSLRKNIEYAVHDGVSLKGHLWRPAGDGPFPLLITIHGGGWRIGSPDSYAQWGPVLAASGFAMFSVSYRLTSASNESTWPQAPCDIRAAVQFMRGKAKQYNIDAERLALMGDSAGGHLASLIGLAADSDLFADSYPDDPFASVSTGVKAVISNYGVHDMVQQWQHDQAVRAHDHIVEIFLGRTPMDDRKLYFDASPMSYATRDKAQTAFLLSHGTEDDVVDRIQTDAFHDALKLAGFFTRKLIIQGAGHYAVREPFDAPNSFAGYLAPRLIQFLNDNV